MGSVRFLVFGLAAATATLGFITACNTGSSVPRQAAATPSPTLTTPAGEKTITFKLAAEPTGSFDMPTDVTLGTAPGPNLGLAAVRYFTAAGTSTDIATTPPGWITRFEVGLSGSANTKMSSSNLCARFGTPGAQNCVAGGGTFPCNDTSNYLHSSEFHCVGPDAANQTAYGTGNSDDGIYLRAYFSNDINVLGANENVLVTIEYLASGINKSEPDARKCITTNTYDPVKCSETVWQIYLKSGDLRPDGTQWNPKPFYMLTPPVEHYSTIAGRQATAGHTVKKQIILPLASLRAAGTPITVFQLSRTGSKYTQNEPNILAACNGANGSPLCVGVIFYSITFQRM